MRQEQSDDEDSVGGNHPTWTTRWGQTEVAQTRVAVTSLSGTRWTVTGATVQPVGSGDGCRRPRRSYSTYPELARSQTNPGIQPEELTLDQVPFRLPGPAARSSRKQLLGSGARPVGSVDGRLRARRFDPTYPRLARC